MGICFSKAKRKLTCFSKAKRKQSASIRSLPSEEPSPIIQPSPQKAGNPSPAFTALPEPTPVEEQNLRVFTVAHLQSATGNFNPSHKIGEGGFGEVFWGELQLRRGVLTKVAIKRLRKEGQEGSQGVKEWQAEVLSLSQLHHPNIVRLIGYCAKGCEKMLVYEFMARGSLDHHLFPELTGDRGEPPRVLPWETRLKIAYQISEALALVHSRGFIHRDVKAANILLDENYDAKLTDFGLARVKVDDQTFVNTIIMGSRGYLDPEVLCQGVFRASSDVYAFGILLLELVTGKHAGLLRNDEDVDLGVLMKQKIAEHMPSHTYIDEQLKASLTPETKYQMKVMARLGCWCAALRGPNRPSTQKVADTIRRLYDNEPRPLS